MRNYFTKILGNDTQKLALGRAAEAGVLPHAYIIEGPEGSGKRTFATHIAAAISCKNRNTDDPAKPLPCLECDVCRKITADLSPDVTYIERGERAVIGVDAAREARSDVFIRPNDTDFKVYIIEEAHTLTIQAQNALLAIIEEPPPGVYFFLLCTDREALLETVRSRAPAIGTSSLPSGVIGDYLCETNKKAVKLKQEDPAGFNALCLTARGSIGKAAELLDTKKRAAAIAAREMCVKTAAACCNEAANSVANLLGAFTAYPQKGAEAAELLEQCCLVFRDILAAKSGRLPVFCPDEEARALSARFSGSRLICLYERFSESAAALRRNANVWLTLVNLAGC